MAASDRFKPIQKLADRKERKAASVLGDAIKNRDAAQKQLDDLKSYHQDYLVRFSEATQRGMDGVRLHEYQLFLDKLEQAIDAQKKALEETQLACQTSKTAWQGSYTKKQAMGNAVGRMQEDERNASEKSDQRLTDDRGPIIK